MGSHKQENISVENTGNLNPDPALVATHRSLFTA